MRVLLLGLLAALVEGTCQATLSVYDPFSASMQFVDGSAAMGLSDASIGTMGLVGGCDITLAYAPQPILFACNGRTPLIADLGSLTDIDRKYSPGIVHVGMYECYTSIMAQEPLMPTIGGPQGGASRQPINETLSAPSTTKGLNVGHVYLLRFDTSPGDVQMMVKFMVLEQEADQTQSAGLAKLRIIWDVIYHVDKTSYDPYNSTNAPCYFTQGNTYFNGVPTPSGAPPLNPTPAPGVGWFPFEIVVVVFGILIAALLVAVVFALYYSCRPAPEYKMLSPMHS